MAVRWRQCRHRPWRACGVPVRYYTPRISLGGSKTTAPCSNDGSTGVCGRWVPGRGSTRGMGHGWVPGGWYTGVLPSDLHWYCQDPTSCLSAVLRPPQALQAPPGPSAHLRLLALNIPSQDQYRRDSTEYILKLVIKPECHWFSLMRPAVVPVSKTGSNVMTLNFSDFHIGQPSLARNKWSCFNVRARFMVKTAKCHRMCTYPGSRGSVTSCRTDQYPRATIIDGHAPH